MSDFAKGTKIKDKYEILDEKGKSVLGTAVYSGRDVETGDDVVIRVIPAASSNDPEMVARFLQSAELAKKLKHSNILPLLDAGDDNGVKYLVSRHEKGFFLNEYLEHRGRLDELESARLVQSLCSALDYAWRELKLIHRNICPDTIFVSKGNIPKLTDFDLAKSLTSDRKLTVDGFTVGDPLYMSPEQARGDSVDFHSDMYCVGLVFYQLLAGAPLFQGKAKMEILRAQVAEAHPPIKSVNPDVTEACSSVLDNMLAKQPADRYGSWSEAIAALDSIIHPAAGGTVKSGDDMSTSRYKMQAISMPAASAEKQAGPAAAKTAKSKTPLMALAVVVLMAAFGIAFFVYSRNQSGRCAQVGARKASLFESKPSIKPAAAENKTEPVDVQKELAPDANGKQTAIPKKTPAPVVETAEKASVVEKKKTIADSAREERNRKACANNLKQIGTALLMYANVFKTKFPEKSGAAGLDDLRKNGIIEIPQIFACPSTGHVAAAPNAPITEEACDYVYVGGLSSEYSDPHTPIAWSKPENHENFGNVLYVNGDVKSFSGSNWLVHTKPPKKKK
ncbi:MAG: protein kinase [Kiritimatiellaeota bacterium]|nr:protein kinase [Kiritimatiellota bacterium]